MLRAHFFGFIVVFVLASCQQNQGSKGSQFERRFGRGNQVNQQLPNPIQTTNFQYTQAEGRIFTESQYATDFNGAMRAFLSSHLESNEIGFISPIDGVRVKGYIEISPQGDVIPERSVLELEIRDEFTGQVVDQKTIPPIKVRIPARSGRAWGQRFDLLFEDQLGWVRLVGQYENGGKSRGVMSFQNRNGKQGDNLQFEIDTCGFFRCQ